jgi:hypothetical protein
MSSDIAARLSGDDSSDTRWFCSICRQLSPSDAGFVLHVLTGFELRSCYRYAANETKPPGYFIRALLRSDHGEQWLAALMDGSKASWWRDLQKARRIAQALRD